MPRSSFRESGTGCIHYGHIYTRYGVYASRTEGFVDSEYASKLTSVSPGDLVVANTSENVEDVGKAVAWCGEVDVVTGGHATVLKSEQNAKYLSYYFRTHHFFAEKIRRACGTKVIELPLSGLSRIKVPVPPLAIQHEVVRVLDQFTQLEVELEAELEARRRQYNYYLNGLMSLDSSVSRMKISDVCAAVYSGGTPKVTDRSLYGGNIPWLRTQEVDYRPIWSTREFISDEGFRSSSAKWVPADSVILAISGAGATRGRVAINRVPVTTNQHCCAMVPDRSLITAEYLYYWLVRAYDDLRGRGRGHRLDLTLKIVKDYEVPVPSVREQSRILEALGQFDALVNDLSSGLPAEIEARRQQYEYYRDRLLAFPEKR